MLLYVQPTCMLYHMSKDTRCFLCLPGSSDTYNFSMMSTLSLFLIFWAKNMRSLNRSVLSEMACFATNISHNLFLSFAGALLDNVDYHYNLYDLVIKFTQRSINYDSGTLVYSSLRIHPAAITNAFDTANKGKRVKVGRARLSKHAMGNSTVFADNNNQSHFICNLVFNTNNMFQFPH